MPFFCPSPPTPISFPPYLLPYLLLYPIKPTPHPAFPAPPHLAPNQHHPYPSSPTKPQIFIPLPSSLFPLPFSLFPFPSPSPHPTPPLSPHLSPPSLIFLPPRLFPLPYYLFPITSPLLPNKIGINNLYFFQKSLVIIPILRYTILIFS